MYDTRLCGCQAHGGAAARTEALAERQHHVNAVLALRERFQRERLGSRDILAADPWSADRLDFEDQLNSWRERTVA